MRFLKAKKDGILCHGCKSYILRDEDMVLNFIPIPGTNHSKILCFHTACYVPWFTEMFNRKWSEWKNGTGNTQPRPKVGRPITNTNPSKRTILNRLMATRTYHKKLGHDIKVSILDNKIAGIKKK